MNIHIPDPGAPWRWPALPVVPGSAPLWPGGPRLRPSSDINSSVLKEDVNAPRAESQIRVGDVLAVTAVDWAMHAEQTARDHDYRIITGTLYGEVIAVLDDGFALAPQVFHDGDVRCTLVVPFVCVKHVEVLKAAT